LTSASQPPERAGANRHSGPAGTSRAGRRNKDRPPRDELSTLERLRTPVLALVVIGALVGIGLFVFTSATAPAYACTSIDTVRTPAQGEVGQVQPDMGNGHVAAGDRITYAVCPPASGKHVSQDGFGPLQPKVYGPDEQGAPNGWVHNLEHGGLVLLYSCDKGACDTTALGALAQFADGFPPSAICHTPAGVVGPVVARFEQMPTRYAALVWDRVAYFDTLDDRQVYAFYLAYGEKVSADGTWIAPPEPQCTAPSPTPATTTATSPSPSGG
jgi:hypothetical protein